jgi:two-component system sensor histidine kinase TctE
MEPARSALPGLPPRPAAEERLERPAAVLLEQSAEPSSPARTLQPSSLRALLTGWLVWPLATLILASAVPTYFMALRAANAAYDSALLDPALAISNHLLQREHSIAIDLPASALDALRIDARDRIFMQVRDSKGQVILGSTQALPPPPGELPEGGHVYYDGALNGERIRIAALQVAQPIEPVLVQVAETYVKRNTMIREMLVATLISELVVAAAAVALLWFGIGRGLAPLDRLRREIAARTPQDLRPVSVADKPDEVRPVIIALNQLLNRLKSAIGGQQRFIANAAHQLRTPLAGLKTHAELARRQPSTVELRSLLDMIAGETERTSHLVNQLLALARAEPEGTAANDMPVNLREVANRAAQEWVPRALAKDIDLGFELDDAWTMGEPMLMRELLANLIDNALSYIPPKGTVTVRTTREGDRAVLEVEDDGPGIPAAERARVFERFYRAQGTVGEGCGLGLAIVAEIAQRHNAHAEILTPAGGTGTLVRASFPTVRAVTRD